MRGYNNQLKNIVTMRKFSIIVLAILGLASCSKSEDKDEQNEVNFGKFVGSWTGTREAFNESGSQVVLSDCERELEVLFKDAGSGKMLIYKDKCGNLGSLFDEISDDDKISDDDEISDDYGFSDDDKNNEVVEIMSFFISVKGNTIIDTETNEPIFSYTFEGDKILKVETLNYVQYIDKKSYLNDIKKSETPLTLEQIKELSNKYTKNVKYKAYLTRK